MTRRTLIGVFLWFLAAPSARADLDYHWVGWSNALIPGSGQAWLGRYDLAAFQAASQLGTFYLGSNLSGSDVFSLDGFTSNQQGRFHTRTNISSETQSLGDILQEFAFKSYMVNTYEAYREAAKRAGKLPENLDDTSTYDLFKSPFQSENISNPYVYLPIVAVAAYTVADYISQTSGTLTRTQRLTPSSNALYAFNYGVWQPIGSGAPEEMFYRGFLQNEALALIPNSVFAIALSTAAFTLSHAPGDGRYSAAVAGSYLGFLADHTHGKLGPGITVHFWSGVILGMETILLNSKQQRNTPPAALDMQLNF